MLGSGATREPRREQRRCGSGGGVERLRRVGMTSDSASREQAGNKFNFEHEWGFFGADRWVLLVSGLRGGPYLSALAATDGIVL
jgi:hypothetical protein